MVAIAGGTTHQPTVVGEQDGFASPTERRIAEALLECTGRWGLAKTTIEDVARSAGVSRATVYRLFPGGKQAILDAAARAEVRALVALISDELRDVDDLAECLVRSIHLAAGFLESHEALTFLREHEPVALEQVLAFDRLDAIFAVATGVLSPVLERFLDHRDAVETGVWVARLVVSYLSTPVAGADLSDRSDVERLVTTFVLPGIDVLQAQRPTTP